MPMNPRLLRPTSSSLDRDAAVYLNAVAVADGEQLEPAVRKAINDFVKGCKQDGIWDAIKASCILAGAKTLAGALVPLKGAAPTNSGPFVTGDYDRETGLIGNATTKYLNSNRNNNADPQDSHHLAVYASALDSNAGGIGIYAGAGVAGAAGSTMLVERGSTPGALRARSRSSTLSSASNNEAVGFLAVGRSAAGTHVIRTNGASSSHSISSDAALDGNHFVFAGNNAGSPTNASNVRLAYYSIGESLDLALLDTRASALIRALRPQAANADAQGWIDRVYANGGTVSTSTANAVNTFCDAIDAAGIRDRFYRLNLFCGTGLNAALVPLYRNTSLAGPALGNATDTNSGALFVSGDYTEPTGLTGGTNKHLDTGLAPDNMPLGVVQAMALSFSHGPTPNLNTDPRPVGAAAISPVTERFVLILTIRSSVTGVLSSTLGRGNALLSAQIAAGPQPSASWVASRTSATSLVAYKNGIADATLATTVTPIASHALPFFVCRSNEGGVATGSAIALPHRHYSIGAGLTGSEVASYDTALAAFRSAIGRTA
jgi:hypothetical protein